MKKIFVLLMAGSLLAFAGAAFGADAGHVVPTPPAPDEPVIVVPDPEPTPVVEIDTGAVLEAASTSNADSATALAAETAAAVAAAGVDEAATEARVESLISGVSGLATQEVSETTIKVTAKTSTEKQAQVAQYAAQGKAVAASMSTLEPQRGGVFTFTLNRFNSAYYGKPITWNPGRSGTRVRVAGVEKADDATFLDSTGAVTTVVPGEGGSATAGYVTVAANLQEGYTYDPVITVEAAEIVDNTELTNTFTAMEAKDGNGTLWISTFVSPDVLAALNLETSNRFNDDMIDGKVSADVDKLEEANKVGMGLFKLKGVSAKKYALYVNFSNLYAAKDTASADITTLALDLSENYVKTTAETAATGEFSVYTWNGTAARDVGKNTPNGAGYLVFEPAAGASNPILTVNVKTSSGGGSSSGGCNAGVTGLGMIPVAFALMALRRKSK